MNKKYYKIDDQTIINIRKYEEQQLSKFKSEFDRLCSNVAKLYGWNYSIFIVRWIDKTFKIGNHLYDGYTATLQVDFTDANGDLIEFDESGCSFFENITFISYNFILRRYRIFLNEELQEIRTEIKQFIHNLEMNGDPA